MSYHVVESAGALYVRLEDHCCIGVREVADVLLNDSCVVVEGKRDVKPSATSAAAKPPIPQRASMAVRREGRGGAVPMAIHVFGGVMWKRPILVLGRVRSTRIGLLVGASWK